MKGTDKNWMIKMGAAWIQNIWWRGIWLNSVKGSHWGMPTSCKVCIELPRAPLMHSLASHTWFGRSDITGGNGAVWILTTASEESINHRPWRISTITTPANQKIKRDSQFVQICGNGRTSDREKKIAATIMWKSSLEKHGKNISGPAAGSRWT